jgi:hypothetical protein
MNTYKLAWIAPALLLCLVGYTLVWKSTHSTGDFADAGILLGGTLMGLALFPLSILADHRSRAKELRKHLRHHHSATPSKPRKV